MKFFRYFLLCILPVVWHPAKLLAQEIPPVAVIDTLPKRMLQLVDIQIEGNKKTREYIIRREMTLHEGQQIAADALDELLAMDRKRITNTRLFLSVNTTIIPLDSTHISILVELKERWYVVPVPIFKLADRNLNDWWTNQDRDLSRVNYGLKFNHYNFMGRAEKLALIAQFGYTRSFRVAYYIPYIDKTRKNGLGLNLLYYDNNNLALRTVNHKRVFINNDDQQLRKTHAAGITVTRRESFYTTHFAQLNFYNDVFADTIMRLNPEFLPRKNSSLNYFMLTYGLRRDLRDNVSYPLKGFHFVGSTTKTGLGFDDVNIFEVAGTAGFYQPLAKRIFLTNVISTRVSTPKVQPYHLLRGLGYGFEYVRGLELYVVEGQHHVLNKIDLKWQLLKHEFDLAEIMPIEQFSKVPLALYPKIFFDVAYVSMRNPLPENDTLVNKPIWGTGVGVDIVSFYDFVFQLEYSMNNLYERGIFIHINRNF